MLDYDNGKRSEQIQLSDAGTGTVLSTQTVSGFTRGAYLNWTISGNVLITITRTGSSNAVLSGLFFDPPSSSGNVVVAGGGLAGLGAGIATSGQAATGQIGTIDPPAAPLSFSLSSGGTGLAGRRTTGTIMESRVETAEVGASSGLTAVAPQAAGTSVSARELVNDVALELVAAGSPWSRARLAF